MTAAPDYGAVMVMAAILNDPDGAAIIQSLSDKERYVLAYEYQLWLRPEQMIPLHDWRYCGDIAGRGWGKSFAKAVEINRRVEDGEARHVGLMAPTVDRVDEVQINFLISTAPAWFRPERYRGGLRWPNGVEAIAFSPEAPGRPRSENLDLTWLCELVDWKPTTRREAFDNITTATRIGKAQVLWDTTSRGKNDVIQHLLDLHKADPHNYPITRGSMFDNPMLSEKYLRAECAKYSGVRYDEEVRGLVFAESAGALWKQAWIDDYRVLERPTDLELVLASIDPAQSARHDADETGIVVGGRGRADRRAYILQDDSGRYTPDQWGDIAVEHCVQGAAGIVLERNKLGDNATFVIRSRAQIRGIETRVLKDVKGQLKPFPRRTPGVIYVREYVSRSSKEDRASGAASETKAGQVPFVGVLDDLEFELTTWEPGASKSPNRLDAVAALISELRELYRERPSSTSKERIVQARDVNRELARRIAAGGRRIGL